MLKFKTKRVQRPKKKSSRPWNEIRIGQGVDIHRLVTGRPLLLGGVKIPHSKGLDGHSDADVLLHAIMDALLGAAGHADIGSMFPDTDKRWKNADSKDLLTRVWKKLASEGWFVVNVDSSVLAEAPKLKPHIGAMKKAISSILNIGESSCGIKATTTEKLGFVGRGEGILASASVLLGRE